MIPNWTASRLCAGRAQLCRQTTAAARSRLWFQANWGLSPENFFGSTEVEIRELRAVLVTGKISKYLYV